MTPKEGHTYVVHFKGRTQTATVKSIRRVRSGAVIAFTEKGQGIPVSTYASWEREVTAQ